MCSFAAVIRKWTFYSALFIGWTVQAQILDDSTQLVYGPETTQSFSQYGILNNQPDTAVIDTSLYFLERFSFTDKARGVIHDLGNIGTAMQPIYFEPPKLSGLRSGYDAYNRIAHTPETYQYFDTKSPYINLQVVLGGQGRATIDLLYTQIVTPNWNIGFEINRLNIDKQLGTDRNEGDRNLESTQLSFFTQFQHRKSHINCLHI